MKGVIAKEQVCHYFNDLLDHDDAHISAKKFMSLYIIQLLYIFSELAFGLPYDGQTSLRMDFYLKLNSSEFDIL